MYLESTITSQILFVWWGGGGLNKTECIDMIIKDLVVDMAKQRAAVAQSGGHWADKVWVLGPNLACVWKQVERISTF